MSHFLKLNKNFTMMTAADSFLKDHVIYTDDGHLKLNISANFGLDQNAHIKLCIY